MNTSVSDNWFRRRMMRWFLFTDFVLPPRAGRWLRRLLPRLDQLEETAMQDCLAESGLHLAHYEYSQAILAGLMKYCIAVAHKTVLFRQ